MSYSHVAWPANQRGISWNSGMASNNSPKQMYK